MKTKQYLAFVMLFLSVAMFGQSVNSINTLKLDDPNNMPAATIEDFAWLAGYWRGEAFGGIVEEIWSEPLGGTMMCMFRLIKDDKVVFYELVLLGKEENSVSMKLKHFNADFTGWETKDENVRFPLVRVEKNAAYFSGLTYRKTSDDSLNVYLVLNYKNGERKEEAFHFARYQPKALSALPKLQMHGVKLKVADMDKAIHFYSNILGFEVLSKADYPNSVSLKNEGLTLILSKTKAAKKIDYPNVEQTGLAFQTNDLLTTIADLKSKGVDFLLDEPSAVGIGIATKFRDPFGNVHSLLEQQVGDTSPFQEPRIYNVGFAISDLQSAREFYCDKLGFVVRTEKYYPAIPLGHADGTFAFMLHEKKDLRKTEVDYNRDSQTVIVYETTNLNATIGAFKNLNIPLLHKTPQPSPQGRYITFLSPAGLASEVVERSPLSVRQ